ncbi:signal recognition particle-docking protein FtsY [Candidatus Pacearchaeota archaeon]|nr:signal recognition particle-docking protein FtsY [Candidatus Pacearchaeota archaeon]
MFDSLKKKFSSWLGIAKDKKEDKKPKPRKGKKQKNEVVKAKDVKKERKVSEQVLEDIKHETSGEIKAIPQIDSESQIIKEEIQEEKKIETPKEELKEEFEKEEKLGFFARLKQKLTSRELKKEEFEEIFYELEITLLENNVALEVVDRIRDSLEKDLVGISVKKSEVDKTIINALKSSILKVLIEPPDLLKQIKSSLEPYIILFFGINGSGKTTSIAKLAHYLKKNGISSVLCAADTFRAASIEQLETHASKLNIPIIKHSYGSDPAAVAFDAIKYAKKNKIKAVLIDTAGRMYTASNLLREMEKVVKVSKPNLKIFVGESITGNDAVDQAKTFNEEIGIDGIILSKADVDEKAGTILSVSSVTNKPIYFLGVGQELNDLVEFKKEYILKNLGLN